MDANKIKFVDDDGSVEVVEPPRTARVHNESPTSPEDWITQEKVIPETIEEESSTEEESVIIISSASGPEAPVSINSSIEDLKSSLELSGDILNLEVCEAVKEPLNEEVIEKVVEHHIKELQKMESVISTSIEPLIGEPDVVNSVEVKVPDCNGGDEDQNIKAEGEVDKESLSLVVNAVNDVRAEKHAPLITPKGCCILQ